MKVAFQGERGAHSENAIMKYFPSSSPIPAREFINVFEMVRDGTVNYGMLPIENSLTGSIHQNYDLLLHFPDTKIVGEITTRIIWCLIAQPGTSISMIRRVLSHPQGLAQCAQFLTGFPEWEPVPFYDTAGAVAEIARVSDSSQAALAGSLAATEHKMSVLAEGIETNSENYTRFVVLARYNHIPISDSTRASIVFSISDKPGSLFQILQILAKQNLNMKKLESRPIPGRPWEYMFYVDLDLPPEYQQFQNAMAQVKEVATSYRLLGEYRPRVSGENYK